MIMDFILSEVEAVRTDLVGCSVNTGTVQDRTDTALDVTVTDPLQVPTLARAETALQKKSTGGRCGRQGQRQGLVFIPLALESLWKWGDGTR